MSKKNDSDTLKPRSNRVLVSMIDAVRRPFVSTLFGGLVHRPYDWSVFGFEACQEEMERRKAIHELMTEDEQKFFDKYCRLRDE